MMPLTTKGMDLNPLFTACTAFRPQGRGGALQLFEKAGIELVHGWLVDVGTPAHQAFENAKVEDYDTALNLLVEVDDLTGGQFVVDEANLDANNNNSASKTLTAEERKKVENAFHIRDFVESTSSQLTYHGLFTLVSVIQTGTLVALFRNSHLSVLYKPSTSTTASAASEDDPTTALEQPTSDSSLFALVTDHAFLQEPTVVWERFDDVDGGASAFVDSNFRPSAPLGGDFVGATAETALAQQFENMGIVDSADQELARQLQDEEDAIARQVYAERERRRQERENAQASRSSLAPAPKLQKKTSCLIM